MKGAGEKKFRAGRLRGSGSELFFFGGAVGHGPAGISLGAGEAQLAPRLGGFTAVEAAAFAPALGDYPPPTLQEAQVADTPNRAAAVFAPPSYHAEAAGFSEGVSVAAGVSRYGPTIFHRMGSNSSLWPHCAHTT